MKMLFAVYILRCTDGKFYTGFTENLEKSILAHQRGEVSFTGQRLPVLLEHVSYFTNKKRACDFERNLKTGSGIAFRNKRSINVTP